MSRRTLASGVSTALVLGAAVVGAPASHAATAVPRGAAAATVTAPVACPEALPTADAVDGLAGTGFTVDRGTAPAPFTATVLGRITDGIAPGVDMIMARLDSPAVAEAGVWAGMSGSPVYTADGRLIGAVAYGLSGSPSPIAGITPAVQMKRILDRPVAAGAVAAATTDGPEKVAVPTTAVRRIAATGAVTRAQAAAGFARLKLPVTVSGLSGTSAGHSAKLLGRLEKRMPGVHVMSGGRAKATGSTAAQITAGGNFGATASYGDITVGGVGTTTFVCDGKAVAFGHPFLFSGRSAMAVHPATAVYVQTDDLFGSFKVANLGSPVGTLDQDRLAGIRGLLDVAPRSALIRSDLTTPDGQTRTGRTRLVHQPFAADVSALHVMSNVDLLLDQIGGGSADVTLKVRGVRPNGKTFTLTRSMSHVDREDLSSAVAQSVYDTVSAITDQRFEKVRLTSVTVTGTVNPDAVGYRVTSLKVKKGTKFVVPGDVVTAKAGGKLALRLRLVPLAGGTARSLDLSVPVPAGTSGAFGDLFVTAGPPVVDLEGVTSFPKVLAALRALPDGRSATGVMTLFDGTPERRSTGTSAADAAVEGFEAFLSVQVR